MAYNKVTEKDINNFIVLYKSGNSLYKITKQTGFKSNTIKKWLRANGVKIKTDETTSYKNKKYLNVKEKEIIQLYVKKLKTVTEISEILLISRELVKYYIGKNNIKLREKNSVKGVFSEEQKQQIVDLYVIEKRGAQYIGKLFDRSATVITYWLNKWGVKKNSRSEISCKIREVYGPTKGFVGRKHKKESKKEISKSGKEAWNKDDRLPIIGKSRTFNTQIGKVLGSYEVAYLQKLIEEGKELPKTVWKRFKTPFGSYMPDFEFDDKFIEIKSEFTLNVAKGIMPDNHGKFSDNQFKKIKWLSRNIKKVEIIVLSKKIAFNFFKKAINSNFVKDKVIIKNGTYKIE